MNAWRMIGVSTAVGLVIATVALTGCQPEGPPVRGLCFQQTRCTGGSLLELPTSNECKAAGGKSWTGMGQRDCTTF
jgi:hypothetical protein